MHLADATVPDLHPRQQVGNRSQRGIHAAVVGIMSTYLAISRVSGNLLFLGSCSEFVPFVGFEVLLFGCLLLTSNGGYVSFVLVLLWANITTAVFSERVANFAATSARVGGRQASSCTSTEVNVTITNASVFRSSSPRIFGPEGGSRFGKILGDSRRWASSTVCWRHLEPNFESFGVVFQHS